MAAYESTFNESYWRAIRGSTGGIAFLDAFYDCFLNSSEEIAAKFDETDMAKLKSMLKRSLVHIAAHYAIQGPNEELETLADKHAHMDLGSAHFNLWLDTLMQTVAACDPEYNDEVDAAWREILRPGLAIMAQRAEE